ncbi:cell division protein FtsL [Lentibacillus amyloliquefaciens]|uniref:Cell division protein FtsL n=1 Tax=Lentibacillus amyloliquefaciens TaxID=1472767 RepID=A0A0U4FNH9_9BACI|nr:cell division protein FtsL [Lentibacillus amyloliquefaciens]ALX47381.1 cell division protein FtsL [Lentibacillus amyloliquefaciens]
MNENLAQSWEKSYSSSAPQQDKQTLVKVRKKGWITKGEKVLYSLVAVMLIAVSIYVVSFASTTDTLNREVESLEANVQHQKVTNEGLVYEKKQLERPERITRIAKENGLKIQDAQVKQATAFNNN